MRKQQRRDWMQQLMRDTTTHSGNTEHEVRKARERAVNPELELVPIDTADANSASVTRSCETGHGRTNAGMFDAASKQATESNTTRLH